MNRLNAHIIMLLLTLPVCAEVEPCLNFSEGENFQRVITSYKSGGKFRFTTVFTTADSVLLCPVLVLSALATSDISPCAPSDFALKNPSDVLTCGEKSRNPVLSG